MGSANNPREQITPASAADLPISGGVIHPHSNDDSNHSYSKDDLNDPEDQKLVSGSSYQQVSRLTIWVHRLSLVVLVVFCIELGMLLAILPWTRVWTENTLLVSYPALGAFMHNNFARGAITGLGLVDMWIGVWEAIHYSDPGRSKPAVHLS
jgi:hypothetical protein